MAAPPQPSSPRYWIRNEFGRVWGPFSLEAVGRVNLGSGDVRERIQASTDGRTFRPLAEVPEVLRALEIAAANAPPVRRFVPVEETRPTPVAPPAPAGSEPTPTPAPPPPVEEEDPGPPESGTLAEHSTIALVARAVGAKRTGKLEVQHPGGQWSVFFKKGTPDRVEGPHGSGELAKFLIRREAAKEEEVERALEITGGEDGDLIDAIVSLQLVPTHEVFPLLGQYAVERFNRFIALEEGEFTWKPHLHSPPGSFPIGQRWQVLANAVRALAPAVVRRRLGSRGLQAVYPSSGGRGRLDELGLTAQETRVAQQFDGTRSPELVARGLPGEREVVMRTALLLGEVGCMAFGPELDLSAEGPARIVDDELPAMEKRSAFQEPPASGQMGGDVGIGKVTLRSVAVKKTEEPAAPEPLVQPPSAAAPSPSAPPPAKPAPSPPPRPVAKSEPPRRPPPARPAPRPEPPRAPPVMSTASHASTAPQPEESVATLQALLEKWKGQNHFEVLGVSQKATGAQIKAAYFALARKHHPDTVTSGHGELRALKADLTARLNEAYGVLGDDAERAKYLEDLRTGGTEKVDIGPILQAEEDYLRATILVKARKYKEALELLEGALRISPEEPDFIAWRAWARFVSATDKRLEYERGLADCRAALKISDRCASAHLFIGQMSKIVGEHARAEKAFRAVLAIEPDNIDARRELRGKT